MLSSKVNTAISKSFSKRKVPKKDNKFLIVNPMKEDQILKFSPHLEELVMSEKVMDTHYFKTHSDRFTEFQWKYKIQNGNPGDVVIDRGVTIEALTPVEEVGTIVIVSKVGYYVPPEERGILAIFNVFIYGAWGFHPNEAVMRINTRGIDETGKVELHNVSLCRMNSELLSKELQIKNLSVGMYVVARTTRPISIGERYAYGARL